jgi:hypothetical protein
LFLRHSSFTGEDLVIILGEAIVLTVPVLLVESPETDDTSRELEASPPSPAVPP